MDAVEEECQARRAEEQAQRDQQPIAPVLNRGRRRTKYHLIPVHVPQNLDNAILDLHRRQLAGQLLRTTQEQRRAEEERQRQMEINQIMEEWRNEDVDALDYEWQQNRNGNGDLNVDRNMQENILRIMSNRFHLLIVNRI